MSATSSTSKFNNPATSNRDKSPGPDAQERRWHFNIKKGLDLPISGRPELIVENTRNVRSVALLGPDYVGMKPTMAVAVGDTVKLGQVLFADKRMPRVCFTSPASGKVTAVNRGEKRSLLSVVVEIAGEEEETFASFPQARLSDLSRGEVVENLLDSGLWTALRTRPFGKIPSPETVPHSLFVNAMDTNPLAAPPHVALRGREHDFRNGLVVVSRLTDGKLYLCHHPGETLPGSDLDFVTCAEFEGPHPAGLVGTHIHYLDPVSAERTVWHLSLQDVVMIGALFTSGRLNVERIVSLAGPMVERPRLVRTRIGANLNDIVADGELKAPLAEATYRDDLSRRHLEPRVISGSVLCGHKAEGPICFLGRYHLQVSVIEEDPKREFIEWHHPGIDRFSVTRLFISKILRITKFRITTCTHGSPRAMVPIGSYEIVLPLDLMPTFLLRALIVEDTDQAQALGCLELDEEDVALCTFACPAKYDYGPILRKNLTMIEVDG